MITVMTWFWQQPGGRATYTADHVNIWADMVRRNLTIPHRLAVVTDVLGDYPGLDVIEPPRDFEDISIPTWGPSFPQCLRRLAMFAPDAATRFGDRFVSMDMDCVVSNSLDPLFDRNDDFVMYRGTAADRPYNGSMVLMTAGSRSKVYTEFSVAGAEEAGRKYVGSDQAWISFCLGRGEATWGPENGVHWWGSRYNTASEPRITFFPGTPKPWNLIQHNRSQLVTDHYRRNPRGRALLLGYGPSIWDDVAEAIKKPFDAVIASPEAAEHWPGDVLTVARDDDHAEALARMLGFADMAWCGQSDAA